MEIEKKVFAYIKEQQMIESGDHLIVGVSGGADSVCLLFLLLKFREITPITFSVVHINHGIRESAQNDEAYVEELCRNFQIPFHAVHADIGAVAGILSCSLEEAGRIVRYEAFEKEAEAVDGAKIAVAHNRNDCGETLLFHLFRGSGIKGLAGIRPVMTRRRADGNFCKVIRPLLCLERSEIERYLMESEIRYCIDETNEEDQYARNRIRHHILPFAEKEISSRSVSHLAQTADFMGVVSDYLDLQAQEAKEKCVKESKDGYEEVREYRIEGKEFLALHAAVQKTLLYNLLVSMSPQARDVAAVHVEKVLLLFGKNGNGKIDLPFEITAKKQYERLYLSRNTTSEEKQNGKEITPLKVQSFPFCDEESGISLEILNLQDFTEEQSAKEFQKIPQNQYTKWFDYDKIEGILQIRSRKQGDFLTLRDPKRGEVTKSVKSYMIDRKIPAEERGEIPLLADGSHILWVIGGRISEHYKVTSATRRILKAEWKAQLT